MDRQAKIIFAELAIDMINHDSIFNIYSKENTNNKDSLNTNEFDSLLNMAIKDF